MTSGIARTGIALAVSAVACSVPSRAQEPARIAGVNIRQALGETQEGKLRRNELESRYAAVDGRLRDMQTEIEGLRARVRYDGDKLAAETRSMLLTEIDRKSRALDRALEDAREEFERDEGRIVDAIASKLIAIVGEYAPRNGYVLVIDSSSPSASVLVLAGSADITAEIVREYDRKHPTDKPVAGS